MGKWFSNGDQHTGWKDSAGEPVTDAEARRIVDKADADWAKKSGHATGGKK